VPSFVWRVYALGSTQSIKRKEPQMKRKRVAEAPGMNFSF
jgi:hypothetical protein